VPNEKEKLIIKQENIHLITGISITTLLYFWGCRRSRLLEGGGIVTLDCQIHTEMVWLISNWILTIIIIWCSKDSGNINARSTSLFVCHRHRIKYQWTLQINTTLTKGVFLFFAIQGLKIAVMAGDCPLHLRSYFSIWLLQVFFWKSFTHHIFPSMNFYRSTKSRIHFPELGLPYQK